jgi:DNA invertase Pin-like site-specific DNA recombinase
MFTDSHRKVRAEHLRRDAFLYVRQSTLRQVFENTESTKRQYALRDRAVALGWPIERVHTIDEDLGRSGAHAQSRDGFQQLVSAVALGRAGIVLGLEVSRLARNNADWQRLLELCALSGCLIADEDGVYDPVHFNDRLLLGLKGTMSEAELHVLKARLIGGQRNKARRGALEVPLPIGLVYDATGAVILDPDPHIQASVRSVFDTFREIRSASTVAARFQRDGHGFPRRIHRGLGKGRVVLGALNESRVLQLLHNPRYAGAYVYGRQRTLRKPDGKEAAITLPRSDWQVLIRNAHPGYISWEEFESNEQILRHNFQTSYFGSRRSRSQESKPLLQGRVLCGRCGTSMRVRDDWSTSPPTYYYVCQGPSGTDSAARCRWIRAETVDAAVGTLLLQAMTPGALRKAISVHNELTRTLAHAEAACLRELAQLRRTAELKRHRFFNCDPDHRLVADTLEADWNEALRQLDVLQQTHEHRRRADHARLEEDSRRQLMALAADFPQAWNDPATGAAERKRMLALLIEDVTLIGGEEITLHVRFRGGQRNSLSIPRPPAPARASKVSAEVIRTLDELLESGECRGARGTRLRSSPRPRHNSSD